MNKKIKKVGVLGGLGPLASASFVETIYTVYLTDSFLKANYHSPYVYLYSEPLLSQSTAVMSIEQNESELLAKLEKNISYLLYQEVDHIVICCFTAHVLLHKMPPLYNTQICCLVTLVLEHVIEQNTQFIVLSASSAREARVLESHPLWLNAKSKMVFVKQEIQENVDALIKAIKDNQPDTYLIDNFLELMNHFPNGKFIIACAELHILHKKLRAYSEIGQDSMFDPFSHVAHAIWGRI